MPQDFEKLRRYFTIAEATASVILGIVFVLWLTGVIK